MKPKKNDGDPFLTFVVGCLFSILFVAVVAGAIALFVFLVRWAWLAAG